MAVADGTIESLTLTNPDGKQVIGQLSPDKTTWTVGEPLGYGKTYTWAGTAKGVDGKSAPISGSFTTVTPARQVDASLNIGDGKTYGVAMPIADHVRPRRDRQGQRAEGDDGRRPPCRPRARGRGSTTARCTGGPRTYWQPGTQVSLAAKLYGTSLGDGKYGAEDRTANFTIGRSQIVQANTQTHRLVVIQRRRAGRGLRRRATGWSRTRAGSRTAARTW